MEGGAASESVEQLAVTSLRGVGPRLGERLHRLGIRTVADLLFHLPLRYQDRTRLSQIAELQPGIDAVVEGEVTDVRIETGRRRSLACILFDGTSSMTMRLFHFTPAQRANLQSAPRLRCFGEVRKGRNGLEMYHPEYRIQRPEDPESTESTLTPVYPSTEGMNQATWRRLSTQALDALANGALSEWVPAGLLQPEVSLAQALRYLHRPPPDAPVEQLQSGSHPFQKRLAAEELLAHHLSLLRLRQRVRSRRGIRITGSGELRRRFLANLPFRPTGAQLRVDEEIGTDLRSGAPMLRLVQGDVGCGKTLVAALASLRVIENGWQAAIMAPTELLAEQHLRNFEQWFSALGLVTTLLSSRLAAAQKRNALAAIADGSAHFAVGTHALLQQPVRFARLGLIIIDEQHRFGVHQRLQLREKGGIEGCAPHQLVMTATPIPRTLAMTAYADLDFSMIDELPPGRLPVTTAIVSGTRRDEVIERVRGACRDGRQAYWVCTLIEESDVLQAEAAEARCADLRERLPELVVALVHGRMAARERLETMNAFKNGSVDLLVATTVIEVGVDVPRASLMIIENAERLGLAQLHQLRGRVGRGNDASHCLLLYQAPVSPNARQRLAAMRETQDGFELAEKDLMLRGPGEMLGTRQTGALELRFADPLRDAELLPAVRKAAHHMMNGGPENVTRLIERWTGGGERYVAV